MNVPVVHIVKRFGRVGGMENYVWHLVHGLADWGVEIIVVCEQVCEEGGPGVRLIQVEKSSEKPRWKSMMIFRARVGEMIRNEFRGQTVLIHSHERSLCHQVTTFHGPPIDPPKTFGRIARFNRRLTAWQQMERDELLGSTVEMVLPVSSQVQVELTDRYPQIANKKLELAWPGVCPPEVGSRRSKRAESDPVSIVFVGKEWRRKGLMLAIRIIEEFRKIHPTARLSVFGADQSEVPRSVRAYEWIRFEGWSSAIPWCDFDLLIHPAHKEPFGMVAAEARSHGIPVVMSTQVGASDLEFSETKILDLDASLVDWCQAVEALTEANTKKQELKWTWNDLVAKHVETIYPQLKAATR